MEGSCHENWYHNMPNTQVFNTISKAAVISLDYKVLALILYLVPKAKVTTIESGTKQHNAQRHRFLLCKTAVHPTGQTEMQMDAHDWFSSSLLMCFDKPKEN